MSDRRSGPSQAAAYRARPVPPNPAHLLRVKHGAPLPLHSLPVPPLATDSAAAPRLEHLRRNTGPRPTLPPDPDYERRLEALADAMLAPATLALDGELRAEDHGKREPAAPAVAPAEAKPARASEAALAVAGRRRPRSGGRVQTAQRREPMLEPSPVQVLPGTPAIAPGHRPPPAPRSSVRAGWAFGVVSLGLMLGLGGAWWLAAKESKQVMAFSGSGSAGSVAASGAGQGPPAVVAGPAGKGAPGTPAKVAKIDPEPTPSRSEQDEVPAAAAAPAPVISTPKPVESAPAPAATLASTKKTAKNSAPAKKSAQTARKRQSEKPANARSDTRTARVDRTARRPATPAVPRDDEIDRLKSQAYSESSRDRSRRGTPPAGSLPQAAPIPPPPPSVTPISTTGTETQRTRMRRELARCDKQEGLFYQERCKWRLCADQWGRNGCPVYEKREPLQ